MAFFDELKRRNVVRVGIAYVVVAWLLAQVADLALGAFGAPDWVLQSFLIVLGLGLPLALFFSWVFEVTPEGIRREKDIDRSASMTRQTGRRLDRLIIGVLVLAVGFLLVDKFLLRGTEDDDGEVIATVGRQSIAVLPFENLSGDDDNFSDGLTEEVLNVLAKNRDLKVAGRTSSFAFKGQTPSSREIGDALNVDHYLEGSVRRSGDTLRITAQLIEVDDGFHVWSETYDREMADVFEIQDEIAGAIADQLHLRLAPAADRPTDNIDAYVKYLEARAILNRQTWPTEPIESRIADALELDPGFARAHELRAVLLWFMTGSQLDGATGSRALHEAAGAALALDPSLIVAGFLHEVTGPGWSWNREFEAIETALAASPDNFDLVRFYCYDLRLTGYAREAVQCGGRIVDLEPLSAVAHWVLGMSLSTQGRYPEALDRYFRAIELGGDFQWYVAATHMAQGQFEQAIGALEGMEGLLGWEPENMRKVVESARDPESGEAFLEQWVADHASMATNSLERYVQYSWYILFGRLDPVFEIIEASVDITPSGWHDAAGLENDAALYPSAGYFRHPGYLRVGRKLGLTELWDTRGAPDMCSKASGEWVCE